MNITTFSPPFRIVGGYFICGFIFLLLSAASFLKADFGAIQAPQTASFFHVFLLGFVISIIIGALYQLTSVIIQKEFFTVKFAFLNLLAYGAGVALLSAGLLLSSIPLMHAGGAVLLLSLFYFTICYALSFIGTPKWSFPAVALAISAAFLAVGISLGFALVLALSGVEIFGVYFSEILSYHIYFVLGFVFFVIVGAACVLLPMFSLAHDLSFALAKASLALYLLAGLFLLKDFGIFIAFAALASFAAQAIYILARRVRKAIDYWNLNIYISLAALGFSAVFWIADRADVAAFWLLYGFLFAFIVAHLYKIAPFLIWYHYVSPFVGKRKTPMLEDMIIKKIAYAACVPNILALACASFGALTPAVILQAASIILVLINTVNIFNYIKFGEEK